MKSQEAQRLLNLQYLEQQHLDQFYNDAVRFHYLLSTYLPVPLFIESMYTSTLTFVSCSKVWALHLGC